MGIKADWGRLLSLEPMGVRRIVDCVMP